MNILLPLLIVIPLVGAAITAVVPARASKGWALAVSLATLACGLGLIGGFDFSQDLSGLPTLEQARQSIQVQFGHGPDNPLALTDLGFRFHLGADTISLWLVILTVALTPLAILSSFDSIHERQNEYYAWMLVLLAAMNGVFIAQDLLLFYIFFELTLVPMFFIIGIWGGPDRRYAAGKFFLYTFAGSIFTLAGVIYLGLKVGSFNIIDIVVWAQHLDPQLANVRFLLLLAFLAGFAVKVPLFPVHTWLPLAHTEAPTAGSVILAGVLLKLGTYGLLRLALPVGLIQAPGADEIDVVAGLAHVSFPNAIWWLGGLCLVGIIYGALVAWVQRDIKKLVAYSSVSHLGFCVLGMLALNPVGMQGSVLYMINHGISTGALFLVVGMIYDRYHTRDIDELSGLGRRMPKLSFFLVLFTMSSIGLPGTNGFVSEFLTILGAFTSDVLGVWFGVIAATGVVLGAIYMLHMVACVLFGRLKTPADSHGQGRQSLHAHHDYDTSDLNAREVGILVPLAVAVIVIGVLPTPLMRSIAQPLELIRSPLTQTVVAEERATQEVLAKAGTGMNTDERR